MLLKNFHVGSSFSSWVNLSIPLRETLSRSVDFPKKRWCFPRAISPSPNAAGGGHAAYGGVPLTPAAQQSLMAATGGAPGAHMGAQQTPAQVPVQMPVQMAPRPNPSACSMVQPLNCLPHQELNHLSSINLNLLRSPASSLPAIQVLPSAEVPINKKVSYSLLSTCNDRHYSHSNQGQHLSYVFGYTGRFT